MISNQVLQSTIDGLKAITRVDICVLGTDGEILAATTDSGAECVDAAIAFVDSPADSQTLAPRNQRKKMTMSSMPSSKKINRDANCSVGTGVI